MKAVRLLLLVAMTAGAVFGVTISRGLVTVESFFPHGPFTLTGENSLSIVLDGFIFNGGFALGVYIPSGDQAPINLGGAVGGSEVIINSAVLNGVPRPDLFFAADLEFTSETVTVDAVGFYTAPFTFSGSFGGYNNQDREICLICPPGENSIPIAGRGIATLGVVPDVEGLIRTETLTYRFIPEPGTMWLLLSGAVLALTWRILRTRQFRRAPWR